MEIFLHGSGHITSINKSIFTVFAVNLSSISYLVEMVEVVEAFSSDVNRVIKI
jgi:hypothetical protein